MLPFVKKSLASLHTAFASECNTAIASTLIVILGLLLTVGGTSMRLASDAAASEFDTSATIFDTVPCSDVISDTDNGLLNGSESLDRDYEDIADDIETGATVVRHPQLRRD